LELPQDWSEYDSENEGTYAFFNTKEWSGNLRITPFRFENNGGEKNEAINVIQSELVDKPGAVLMTVKSWDAAFYIEADEENMIYYWVTGFKNSLFLISFTFDNDAKGTLQHKTTLETVTQILNTIEIID